MKTVVRTVALVQLACLAAACSSAGELRHHYFHKTEQKQPHPAEWSYTGDLGPSHWGDLCPEYRLAGTGRQQSPIDISRPVAEDLPQLQFDYRPATINLIYNGHTIEEKEDRKSSVTDRGTEYVLQQFHFHSPSEHTLDGDHTAMEMHLVHESADKQVAVVSLMIRAGAENQAFAPIWGYLPTDANRTRQATVTVDADDLLPADRGYLRYMGSFTTPPCTEGVVWFVLQTPVELSKAQIDRFRAVIKDNNRPVQPLNGRKVAASD